MYVEETSCTPRHGIEPWLVLSGEIQAGSITEHDVRLLHVMAKNSLTWRRYNTSWRQCCMTSCEGCEVIDYCVFDSQTMSVEK